MMDSQWPVHFALIGKYIQSRATLLSCQLDIQEDSQEI